MKRLLLLVGLLFAVMLISSPVPSITSASEGTKKQRAEFRFTQPVNLMGVTLEGNYLFVHDDAAMARGEACTYVYKGNADIRERLVVSFHCQPKEREKASHFTVRSWQAPSGLKEIIEFQFAGSTESHLVPVSMH